MTAPTLPPTPATIANLPLASTPLVGNEFLPISQNGVTCKVAANGVAIVGPVGPTGSQGLQGAAGAAGATGATGATGPQGPIGNTGATGPSGAISATSSSSINIATGAQTFTTQSGLPIVPGQILIIASNANASNYMHGSVTSYVGTSLVMNITDTGGSGTLADWNISISGTQGTPGSGSGSVTSVTFTGDGTVLSSTPSTAVTASGTLNATLLTQTANKVFAGPTTGAAANPTFRSIVVADLPVATSTTVGAVSPDGTIITVSGAGAITVPKATSAIFGVVEVDNTTITSAAGVITAKTATSAAVGVVKPDGAIITVSGAGAITVPQSTSTVFGVVKPDGTTITATGGVLSAASSGALVQIGTTQVASGASTVDFTSGITSTYNHYILDCSNITTSGSDQTILFRVQQGGNFLTSSTYQWSLNTNVTNTTSSGNDSSIRLCVAVSNGLSGDFIIVDIFNPATAADIGIYARGTMDQGSGTSPNTFTSSGTNSAGAATTGFRILPSSGTISGTFSLYGVAK